MNFPQEMTQFVVHDTDIRLRPHILQAQREAR